MTMPHPGCTPVSWLSAQAAYCSASQDVTPCTARGRPLRIRAALRSLIRLRRDLEPDHPAQLVTGMPPTVGEHLDDAQPPPPGQHARTVIPAGHPRLRRAALVGHLHPHAVARREHGHGDIEPAAVSLDRKST